MSHQSPGQPGKMFESNWRQLGTSRNEDKSDLKEIPVDVLTGGGELLLLGSGQQLVNVLHTSSLRKMQVCICNS